MKKKSLPLVSTIIIAILICFGISSCSKSNHVVSSNFIQKRKYTNGFFVNKHPNKINSAGKNDVQQIEELVKSHEESVVETLPTEFLSEEFREVKEMENTELALQEVKAIEGTILTNRIRHTPSFSLSSGVTIVKKSIKTKFNLLSKSVSTELKSSTKIGLIFLGIGIGVGVLGIVIFSVFGFGPGAIEALGWLGLIMLALGTISAITGLVYLTISLFM